jgi:phosphoribosyl 1,2-cyclic phosphate phosphodiesterase
VPRPLATIDIMGQMILLGTGTSVGVPIIGCGCEVCRSPNPRNKRTRCSAILGLPYGNLLIDTSPDLREQLLREQIGIVHAVLYTHEHADHIFGLDDLRIMQFYLGGAVPLYCEEKVESRIRKSYDYAFDNRGAAMHAGAVPQLALHRIGTEPFELLGARITPIRMQHGPHFDVLGFRVGNAAYCTDVNEIPAASMDLLRGLDCLVLDALRPKGHATHFGLDEAISVAAELAPRQTYFTHTSHELEYDATNAALPPGMAMAYDGLRIPLR